MLDFKISMFIENICVKNLDVNISKSTAFIRKYLYTKSVSISLYKIIEGSLNFPSEGSIIESS